MEESNSKNNFFTDLYDLYLKTKVEIRCQYEKGDKCEHFYYEPVLQAIENILKNEHPDLEATKKLIIMKAALLYEHARFVSSTINDSEESPSIQLQKDSLSLLEEYKEDPETIYLYFRNLNILAYTFSKMGKFEEALKYADDAERLYDEIKGKEIPMFLTDELFQNAVTNQPSANVNCMSFEKLVTNNYQIQAWIYNKINITENFLRYYHTVLGRQLQNQEGSAVIWFYKCARLGVQFFSTNRFTEAKQHLAASCTVLREYELELLKHRSEPHFISEWYNLKKYYADMGKYWTKYGLFLLNASRNLAPNLILSEHTLNDFLVNSFQEYGPANDPTREWFNIKKNSLLFPPSKKSSNEILNDIQGTPSKNDCQKLEECSDKNQNSSTTQLSYKKSEKIQIENLLTNMQDEINKLNVEAENDTEEITDMTKSIIEALDDRKKEVENTKETANDECKLEQNDSEVKEEIKQIIEIKIESILPNEKKSETDISTQKNESSESLKNQKETVKKDSRTSNCSKHSSSSRVEDNPAYDFSFPSLDLSSFDQVPSALIDNTNTAREFFLYIKEWIKRSKMFYTIQDYPNEYIQLILDLNELYRYLSTYETDLESQYDVQRRRVEILETLSTLLKGVHPQDHLFLCIELLQELIQAQVDLLMLNIRRLSHVQSSGGLLLKDICQEHNDALRKMQALVEIQKRLGGKDTRSSTSSVASPLFS